MLLLALAALGGVVISLAAISGSTYTATGVTLVATTTITVSDTGALQIDKNEDGVGAYLVNDFWIRPQISMANFTAYLHVNSGSLSSGTEDTALNLGTSRQWTVQQLAGGTKTANVTLEIRDASGTNVLKSVTFTITAQM